jgi:hypothetical protein
MSDCAPFVCRWANAHSESQYFDDEVNFKNHVYDHIITTDLK